MIETIFAAYGIATLVLFRLLAPSHAVAATCFAGWLLLPVGNFPAGSTGTVFPYWITGVAVPSDMLLTKIWWPPVIALIGACLVDRQNLMRWRPNWADVPIAIWCLWPILQWPLVENPDPPPWIASLYLSAAWGVPWLLGRVYFFGQDGGRRLVGWMVAGIVLIVPIALVEGAFGPRYYGWFYGLHPFRFDGVQRYVGFRPLGFFEHGNQYGIWVAANALAAIWFWETSVDLRWRGLFSTAAILSFAIALLSQSLGAIALLLAGLALTFTISRSLMRLAFTLVFILIISGGLVYLSGNLPLRSLAERTVVGRHIVETTRSLGRGSFIWRIARDQAALPLIDEHPLVGTGRWDWWRANSERPWGLALLILGQFGLIGLAFAFGTMLAPALRALVARRATGSAPAIPLAVMVLMASGDALLNSFVFYPAILFAGALVAGKESCAANSSRIPCPRFS